MPDKDEQLCAYSFLLIQNLLFSDFRDCCRKRILDLAISLEDFEQQRQNFI